MCKGNEPMAGSLKRVCLFKGVLARATSDSWLCSKYDMINLARRNQCYYVYIRSSRRVFASNIMLIWVAHPSRHFRRYYDEHLKIIVFLWSARLNQALIRIRHDIYQVSLDYVSLLLIISIIINTCTSLRTARPISRINRTV